MSASHVGAERAGGQGRVLRVGFSHFTGKPFTAADFAAWYSCPDARLVPVRAFADPSNWSGNNEVVAGKGRWYYITTNDRGERVKGEAVVEELAEVGK